MKIKCFVCSFDISQAYHLIKLLQLNSATSLHCLVENRDYIQTYLYFLKIWFDSTLKISYCHKHSTVKVLAFSLKKFNFLSTICTGKRPLLGNEVGRLEMFCTRNWSTNFLIQNFCYSHFKLLFKVFELQ